MLAGTSFEPRDCFSLFEAIDLQQTRSVNMFDAVTVAKDSERHSGGEISKNVVMRSRKSLRKSRGYSNLGYL